MGGEASTTFSYPAILTGSPYYTCFIIYFWADFLLTRTHINNLCVVCNRNIYLYLVFQDFKKVSAAQVEDAGEYSNLSPFVTRSSQSKKVEESFEMGVIVENV